MKSKRLNSAFRLKSGMPAYGQNSAGKHLTFTRPIIRLLPRKLVLTTCQDFKFTIWSILSFHRVFLTHFWLGMSSWQTKLILEAVKNYSPGLYPVIFMAFVNFWQASWYLSSLKRIHPKSTSVSESSLGICSTRLFAPCTSEEEDWAMIKIFKNLFNSTLVLF